MKVLSKKTTWPLFWCLSPGSQAKLMQYQWDEYGFRLEIPPLPSDIHIGAVSIGYLESPEEIDRLMRQRPHYPREVKWRG